MIISIAFFKSTIILTCMHLLNLTYEESNSIVNSSCRKFLDNSKDLVVNSLLVKYYVPLEYINEAFKVADLNNIRTLLICFITLLICAKGM